MASIFLAMRLIPPEQAQSRQWIVGWSTAICCIFFMDVLTRGQFGLLLLFCIMLTLFGWLTKRKWLAGLALGFAIAIKITPAGLLLVFFLLKREFKLLLWSCAGLIIFSVCIPSVFFGLEETIELLLVWVKTVPTTVFDIPAEGEDANKKIGYLQNYRTGPMDTYKDAIEVMNEANGKALAVTLTRMLSEGLLVVDHSLMTDEDKPLSLT